MARLMSSLFSFTENWSTYIDTISMEEVYFTPSMVNPSSIFVTITSAWDRSQYSVMIAAILFLLFIALLLSSPYSTSPCGLPSSHASWVAVIAWLRRSIEPHYDKRYPG